MFARLLQPVVTSWWRELPGVGDAGKCENAVNDRPRSVRNGNAAHCHPPSRGKGKVGGRAMPTGDARNAALEILHYDAVAQREEIERLQQNAGSQQARIDYLEGANAELCIELQATNDHHQRRIADLQQVRHTPSTTLTHSGPCYSQHGSGFCSVARGARSRPRGERLCVQGRGRQCRARGVVWRARCPLVASYEGGHGVCRH